MTYKKIKTELSKALDEKKIYKASDKDFIIGLTDFIYIEKQKSFWFAIVLLLVVCPIVIFGLLYLIQTILYV